MKEKMRNIMNGRRGKMKKRKTDNNKYYNKQIKFKKKKKIELNKYMRAVHEPYHTS